MLLRMVLRMFNYDKDKEFNKIGRCWFLWCMNENDKFYNQIYKEYDEDLYLMYDHLRYIKKRLNKLFEACKFCNEPMKEDFLNFSRELVKTIETMIYSKEIHEKYDN